MKRIVKNLFIQISLSLIAVSLFLFLFKIKDKETIILALFTTIVSSIIFIIQEENEKK